MKLTQIDITNFRCFESLMVPLQPDVNVFVGVNASGKTALLDAIAIALYGIVAAHVGGGNRQRALQGVDWRLSDIPMRPGSQDSVGRLAESVQIARRQALTTPCLTFQHRRHWVRRCCLNGQIPSDSACPIISFPITWATSVPTSMHSGMRSATPPKDIDSIAGGGLLSCPSPHLADAADGRHFSGADGAPGRLPA